MFCEISQELNLQHKASDVWLVGAAVANRNFVVAAARWLLSAVCWPDVLGSVTRHCTLKPNQLPERIVRRGLAFGPNQGVSENFPNLLKSASQ